MLGRWVREFKKSQERAFPGHGVQNTDDAELIRLKHEVAQLRMERDILKKPQPSLPRSRREVWPHRKRPEGSGRLDCCARRFDRSKSGFCAWITRPKSTWERIDEVITPHVYQSFVASDRTYGARRIVKDMLELGHRCGLHKIERLMKAQALRARPRRRAKPIDHGDRLPSAIGSNLLDRQFVADAPNKKWVADFTYIWTAEGWLYVAAVLDLYSRRIVGWSMQSSITS